MRLRALWVVIRRDILINASYRAAFVMDAFFGMINLLIYYFISAALRPEPGVDLGGAGSYFAFAAAGVTITAVVQAANTSLARRIREEQLTGTLEVLVAHPLSAVEMACGFAVFPCAFAAVRASLYLVAADAFLGLDLSAASWPGFVVVMAVTGAALSSLGIALGALTLVFKRTELLASILTLGLGLGGGAFFPVSVLPSWARGVAALLPTRWVFDGIRDALFLGRAWAGDAAALTAFTAVALPLALAGFGFSLRLARAQGTLGQY